MSMEHDVRVQHSRTLVLIRKGSNDDDNDDDNDDQKLLRQWAIEYCRRIKGPGMNEGPVSNALAPRSNKVFHAQPPPLMVRQRTYSVRQEECLQWPLVPSSEPSQVPRTADTRRSNHERWTSKRFLYKQNKPEAKYSWASSVFLVYTTYWKRYGLVT